MDMDLDKSQEKPANGQFRTFCQPFRMDLRTSGICKPLFPRVHAETIDVSGVSGRYIVEYPKDETGGQRVLNIFRSFLSGNYNGEAGLIQNALHAGALGGMTYGMLVGNKDTLYEFARKYNEYTFEGDFKAKRSLHDYVFIKTMKKMFMSGWRCAALSGSFATLIMSSFAYRNDIRVLDFGLSCTLAFGLYRFPGGMRATAAAGAIGFVFGMTGGAIAKLAFWASGVSVPEFRYWLDERYYENNTLLRRNLIKEKSNIYSNDNTEILLDKHQKLFEEKLKRGDSVLINIPPVPSS